MALVRKDAQVDCTLEHAAAQPRASDDRVSKTAECDPLWPLSMVQTGTDASNNVTPVGADIAQDSVHLLPALHSKQTKRVPLPTAAMARLLGGEPGFYIVQDVMSRFDLEALLLQQPVDAVLKHFRDVNLHLSRYCKPGQLVVLSDPRKSGWRAEEAVLKQVAAKVNDVVQPMTEDEAAFMVRHQLQIQSFLTQGQGTLGEVIFSNHLGHIQNLLSQLEEMHPRTFQPQKGLNIQEFFTIRQELLAQFHQSLSTLVTRGAGAPESPLATLRGYGGHGPIHHWSKAGAPGGLMGYATHIDSVAPACRYLKNGGWLGIALKDCSAARKISALCRIGREAECHSVCLSDSRTWGVDLNGSAKVRADAEAGVWVALGLEANEKLACALVISEGLMSSGQAKLAQQIYKVRL
ncbi:hypothetical protein [Pseudomonas zeae]|uniref:hypothetical protein n=1 Tax=Pseudomonas zeae TaxID=2745510 RepID=UPI0039E1C991